MRFSTFYTEVFLPEHRHPMNVALHGLGTALGLVLLVFAAWRGPWWIAVFFPAVHAMPGLVGHRLFERNADLGDVRITRVDHPLWWFIVANHRMAWEGLIARGRR
ncbi:MAG: DUF962 domain-containing protein [Silanimonas sp.]